MSSLASHASTDGVLHAGLVWRGDRLATGSGPVLPTGFAALDAVLPGGGWPANALVELLAERPGIGELSLLLPLMRVIGAGRWLAWIAPPLLPHAAALEAAGVPLERLLLLDPPRPEQALWATRQALASGSCSAVLAWPQRIDGAGLRRLQLAAEDGATPLFLFRPPAAARQASPAPLRLLLSAAPGALEIHILKRRGPPLTAPLRLPVHDGLVAAAEPSAAVQPFHPAPTAVAPSLQAG
ncbi:translesion DNA synthesis-associated protein ImuA [Thauera phenolivorans]|uniref:translesion DNA synthesis-associated protein ImuA n=1 Tax=Thauera phenolivorans TaxID=1792543 RepID=UPI000839EB1D|nr:translesion DNA synthesis-associated protein ImuA [Thauera phenolivorans]